MIPDGLTSLFHLLDARINKSLKANLKKIVEYVDVRKWKIFSEGSQLWHESLEIPCEGIIKLWKELKRGIIQKYLL